jgi:hypothetical protein
MSTVTVIFIAVGIVSVIGIVTAFITTNRVLSIPKSLDADESQWPYDEGNYLW